MNQNRNPAEDAIAKTLRLRAATPPVARLSRRALIATGVLVSLSLCGAVGWSLAQRERARPPVAEAPRMATPSERVTALPRGYVGPAGVPTLGPPLPGDLGRPMLNAQRQGKSTDWPTPQGAENRPVSAEPGGSWPPPASSLTARPEADVQTIARQTARQSGLFAAQSAGAGRAIGPSPAPAAEVGQADTRTTSVERLQAPASPYVLQAGAMIPAALITGLRSDAPGLAIAQVTQDVHDSLGGGVLLIPAGARLVGDYDAQVQGGQARLRVSWTRLILPSGRSIILDKLPAADAQGMAGLQDGVDRHGRQVLAAAGLSTLLAIGAEAGGDRDEDALVRALRRGGGNTASQMGQQIVGRSLDLKPTLTIRPGAPLRVLLSHDLVLEPYQERNAR
ncbi:TrbI/VirB10 family protein [Caulobacter sp. RHG1]|uniref:TrbI/VirB10 family protein n=1 Tax=Caulobacter sp. (strain RHG1) TaxID=2545762 RepID=UPI0015528EB9|nr:TrbI/VirB10 family protein [Caulobacter sp. RHG1]NQE61467.1 Conjugative transfer protein TrbI [Caulobacter sp. RHG1]